MAKLAHLLLLSPPALLCLSGCLLGTGVPFEVEAQSQPLGVDAERARVEAELCADPATLDCAVLVALDGADGTSGTPPALPSSLPEQVRVGGQDPGAHDVEVGPWLAGQLADHGLLPVRRFSLGAEVAGAFGDAMDGASLVEAGLVLGDNTLTFDLPPFEIWAGFDDERDDTEESIAAGVMTRVAVTEAVAAGTASYSLLSFTDGGSELLLEILREGGAMAVRADPGVELVLPEGDAPDTIARPGGAVQVSLRLAGEAALPLLRLVGDAR